ncbi:MAG: hypothetical protein KKC84_00275, partial [Candidatus Omnitrophica bacterium]|nr:hypothetical protein [Candidatus Omnitrophota bacterium]
MPHEVDRPTIHALLNETQQLRHKQIEKLEIQLKATVITYTANFQHPAGGMNYKDIPAFQSMLDSLGVRKKKRIAFIIHSPGGIVHVAEK